MTDEEAIKLLRERLKIVRRVQHPIFAIGLWHALGYLGEEYGEVLKVATKSAPKDLPGWESRMDDCLIDLCVIVFRMLNREYQGNE